MSLTQDDLEAMERLFDKKFDEKFEQVIKPELGALDYKIDKLSEDAKAANDELKSELVNVKASLRRIENAQQAEAGRADRHDREIASINRELGLV